MKNKTIVLIYPNPTQAYNAERRRDIHSIRRIYAPLSIMYLAATLEEAGFTVRSFDERLTPLEEIHQEISREKDILFIGLSAMTGSQIGNGLRVARSMKSVYPDAPIMWGGVHPTLYPEKTIVHPLVDIICIGEGDLSVVELAKTLANGKPIEKSRGLYIKKEGQVIKTPPIDRIDPLDELPMPAWHHFEKYLNPAQYPILATITTSRGCPYGCTYCYKTGTDPTQKGSIWRAFSTKRMLDEVDHLYNKYGFDVFEMADENFILRTDRAIETIRGFKERNFKISAIRSNFQTYKDAVIKELSGFCDYLCYSPETGSKNIQRYINKRADFGEMKILNAKLRDLNITTVHTFIFAFPFETDEDIIATVNLCKDFKRINPACRMALYQYMPYPGAPLTNMMTSQYGLELPDDFEEWSRCDMYGELDLRFRPWIDKSELGFYNNFQLLFNTIFNSYQELGEEEFRLWESYPKIRELMGDISTIPRVTKVPIHNKLNERITPDLLETCKDKVFVGDV